LQTEYFRFCLFWEIAQKSNPEVASQCESVSAVPILPKLQLLSGHAEEKSLAIYRDLALADVSGEYEQAMRSFPVRHVS
jgi:hypothetical protein